MNRVRALSLRTRVLAGLSLVAVVLVGAAIFIVNTTRTNLIDQVDRQLEGARGPVGRTGVIRGVPPATPPTGGTPRPLSSIYVGVVTASSVDTLISPNLAGNEASLPAIQPSAALAAAQTGKPFTVAAADATRHYRVRASTDEATGSTFVVALPLDSVDNAVARLRVVMLVTTLGILAVLGLVAWWVVHLGVRPIKRMTRTAVAIADGDLALRVPDAPSGTEAGELGDALNHMLSHIEDAFDERARSESRLRQFVADASHELRTPITTIRGYVELFRAGGLDDRTDLDEAMRRTEQEAVRMSALVEDLLQLARVDVDRKLERKSVDLCNIARDVARDAAAIDPQRAIALDIQQTVSVMGDENQLRQVLGNLVTNALVHTPPSAGVTITVAERGDAGLLEVSDAGPGMPPAVAEHAFERFYRGDPARSRARGGTGLGLAIVEALVEAHSGEVALQSSVAGGTTVSVTLPCASLS
jgi:two-component system OmpR family sensor kinase